MAYSNLELKKETARKYYIKNKEKLLKYSKEYKIKNKEKVLKKRKEYYWENIEKSKEYYLNNKKEIIKKRVIYYKYKYHTDINFKLKSLLRKRIRNVITNNYKSKKTMELLGCTIEEFKKYLESKFTKGMSWDKMSLIHIDHIKPCAAFDLTKPKEQAKCFHYTNLQPLWAIDNLKKGAKYEKYKII